MNTSNDKNQNVSSVQNCQVFTLADYRKGDHRLIQPTPIAAACGAQQPVLKATRLRRDEVAVEGVPGLRKVTYPSGRETWIYRYTDPLTDKRPCITIGDCRDIDEIAARIEARTYAQRLQAGLSPRQSSMTLAAYFDRHYLPWAKANKRSWRDDESRFNLYIRDGLGQKVACTITAREIKALGEELRQEKGLADSTVNAVLNLFKAIFREGCNAGAIEANPAKQVKLLKVDNLRHEIYSDEEIARILPALNAINPLVGKLFVMLLGTGARIGELLNARHADVDEAARTLRLVKTKSGRPMTLPLSQVVMAIYADLKALAREGNPHLFPASHGCGPMSPPRKAFQKVLAGLGIRNRTFHDARRTAISAVVQLPGMSVLDASRLANHASVRLTETRYVVVGQERLRMAVEGLSQALPLGLAIKPLNHPQPTVRSVAVNDSRPFITGVAQSA